MERISSRSKVFRKLCSIVLAVTLCTTALLFGVSTPAQADDDIVIHMHGGGGLHFKFYFWTPPDFDLGTPYIVEVDGTYNGQNSSGATTLAQGDKLWKVEVYSSSLLVDTIMPGDIGHQGSGKKLTADGSIDPTGLLERNSGTINFWFNHSYGDIDNVSISLRASKTIVGGLLINGQFNFEVVDSTGTVVVSATNDANGVIVFPSISYGTSDIGTHTYTIREMAGSGGPRWIHDSTTFSVQVDVAFDSTLGVMTATATYPADGVVFTNTYITAYATTLLTLDGKKIAVGAALEDGMFEFAIIDSNGDVVSTGTNDADGNIIFDPITYDDVGTYLYTVVETSTSGNGWTTDNAVFEVSVSVVADSQNPDLLIATPTYLNGDIEFTNTFVSPIVPKTEDSALAMVLIAGLLMAAGIAASLWSRKRTA